MKITIDIKNLAIAAASFGIAYGIITEKIDQYIHFAGEENALGCFVITSMMGVFALVGTFSKKVSQ